MSVCRGGVCVCVCVCESYVCMCVTMCLKGVTKSYPDQYRAGSLTLRAWSTQTPVITDPGTSRGVALMV